MASQIISVKELRQKFPAVRRQLERGKPFIIVHRSKPLANLTPIAQQGDRFQKWPLDKIAGSINLSKYLKRKLTAKYIDKLANTVND